MSEAFLNDFFVTTFNKVLAIEEDAITEYFDDLSVCEIHVIAAVKSLSLNNNNTMSQIAQRLMLSPGALSITVSTLVKKGYLVRKSSDSDRRKVFIYLTECAEDANKLHDLFHEKMVSGIMQELSADELELLERALVVLGNFFARHNEPVLM